MDQATARKEAISAYNRSFDLLDLAERTELEDAELLAAAWTSRHRWMVAGGTKEVVIADWMISRVAAALGATSQVLLSCRWTWRRARWLALATTLTTG